MKKTEWIYSGETNKNKTNNVKKVKKLERNLDTLYWDNTPVINVSKH